MCLKLTDVFLAATIYPPSSVFLICWSFPSSLLLLLSSLGVGPQSRLRPPILDTLVSVITTFRVNIFLGEVHIRNCILSWESFSWHWYNYRHQCTYSRLLVSCFKRLSKCQQPSLSLGAYYTHELKSLPDLLNRADNICRARSAFVRRNSPLCIAQRDSIV